MYHIEFITEKGWETAFAATHKAACLLADALQDACGDEIRAYYVKPAGTEDLAVHATIQHLDWRQFIEDGIYMNG